MQNLEEKHLEESNCSSANSDQRDWALKLYSKSPLKQKKFEMISKFCPKTAGKVCLDIGSDNGVISLLLRQQGGEWHSADLIEETVTSIRELVQTNVDQISGTKTPYIDNQFDLVIIVDFLEHIETDSTFVNELKRILKPTGHLIINVPNPKQGLLRKLQFLIGQTDLAHGHVRPGYTVEELQQLLGSGFKIQQHESYSRFFSVLIDTLITFALDILKGKRGQKGTVVTKNDLTKMKKSFKLFSLIYPVISLFVTLDKLVPFSHGNMLIAVASKE
ncbi:MAG: class I SAM-dependent methyltransferase [Deltaproteobacteria bacterium]|nr:class I SAM-dependent methyltransferase [Deltaproteobacteria bacterium]